MKKVAAICIFILIGISLHAENLSWDITFVKDVKGSQESVSISEMIEMKNGEFFQITIKPETNCYCYVIAYDSNRQVWVLNKDHAVKGGVPFFIDPIEIDGPAGTDIVYIIMSLERQTKLESLIQAYNNRNSQQNADALREEVLSLQNTVSKLGEPVPRILSVGGTTRGTSVYVTNFSDKNGYVRSIAIRHK